MKKKRPDLAIPPGGVVCPRCNGSGDDPSGFGVRYCTRCNGSGLVSESSLPTPEGATTCPHCGADWPHHHTRDGRPMPSHDPEKKARKA